PEREARKYMAAHYRTAARRIPAIKISMLAAHRSLKSSRKSPKIRDLQVEKCPFSVRGCRTWEDHDAHQCLGVESPVRRAQRAFQGAVQSELLPDFRQQPAAPKLQRRFEVRGPFDAVRHVTPRRLEQSGDQAVDLLGGQLVGAAELGDLSLSGASGRVAIGLDQAQVGVLSGAGGAQVHGSTVSHLPCSNTSSRPTNI